MPDSYLAQDTMVIDSLSRKSPREQMVVAPFVTSVNNRDVLNRNLLRSPDVSTLGLRIYENPEAAACAYNDALLKAGPGSEYTIFVHQDIYLPAGWPDRLQGILASLADYDRSWAVAGCYGFTAEGKGVGHVYSNGHGIVGGAFGWPVKVRTLDEIVLIVRHMPGLRFTSTHPGFHMYGTDICLRAEQLGLSCYAIDNYCVHNTRYQSFLPPGFYSGYRAIVRHFPAALPVHSSCIGEVRSVWRMRRIIFRQSIAKLRGRGRVIERLPDPTVVL